MILSLMLSFPFLLKSNLKLFRLHLLIPFCVLFSPAMNGNVDPAVLASLPPSMQLDLLVQVTNDIDSISSHHVELH